MKSLEDLTKKRKTLNKDINKACKENAKIKFKRKAIKSKNNGKLALLKNDKKIKSIEILRNTEVTSTAVAMGKEKKKLLKKEGINEKLEKKKLAKKKVIELKEKEDDINFKDLSKKHILQCISAIFHLTQEQLKNNKDLFSGESEPIFVQVTCIRVPKVPRRQMRMILPHSIVSSEDDIALFVCDLERGRRKDYEPTIDHYRELLDKCGCTKIKDIIPMNQVKTEYDQYELKRKLVASYDHFLVDGRIAGHMSHLLGKIFNKKHKFLTSIRMDSKDLKCQIDYALQKTVMRSHSFGDCHTIQVANTSMKKKHILENIIALCNNLAKVYPGGWSNIRAIRLKTKTGPSLLIYLTLKNKNTVGTPVVKPKRPKAYRNVEGELTTLSGNANVIVTPEGNVIVKQTFPDESEVSEDDDESVEKE